MLCIVTTLYAEVILSYIAWPEIKTRMKEIEYKYFS